MNMRQLGKNTLIYAMGNVCLRAASFLLIPLFTYSLSLNDYGVLSILLTTVQLFIMVMNFGMEVALVRFTNDFQTKGKANVLIGSTILVNLVCGVSVIILCFLFLQPLFRDLLHTQEVLAFILLSSLIGLLQSLSGHVMACYRAKDQALKFMVIGVASAGALIVCNFLFLWVWPKEINGVLTAYILTYGLLLFLVCIDLVSTTGLSISLAVLKRVIRFSYPLLGSMVARFLMTSASLYALGIFKDLKSVAVYSLGLKLSGFVGILINLPFQQAFQPFVFFSKDEPNLREKTSKLFTYLVAAASAITCLIVMLSRVLMPFLAPPEYASACTVVLFLVPAMAVMGIYYFGETLLSAVDKTSYVGYTMTVFGIASVCMSWILVPRLADWYGAVVVTSVVNFGGALTVLTMAVRIRSIRLERKRLFVLCTLLVGCLGLFYSLRDVSLGLYMIIAGSIFLALLWMLYPIVRLENNDVFRIWKYLPFTLNGIRRELSQGH